MKLLLDACLSPGIVAVQQEEKHDKDFGRLVFERGLPHAGLVRIAPSVWIDDQPFRLRTVLARHGDRLRVGGVITVDKDKDRFRTAVDEGASERTSTSSPLG